MLKELAINARHMPTVGESSKSNEGIAEIWQFLLTGRWFVELSSLVINQLQSEARLFCVEANG